MSLFCLSRRNRNFILFILPIWKLAFIFLFVHVDSYCSFCWYSRLSNCWTSPYFSGCPFFVLLTFWLRFSSLYFWAIFVVTDRSYFWSRRTKLFEQGRDVVLITTVHLIYCFFFSIFLFIPLVRFHFLFIPLVFVKSNMRVSTCACKTRLNRERSLGFFAHI